MLPRCTARHVTDEEHATRRDRAAPLGSRRLEGQPCTHHAAGTTAREASARSPSHAVCRPRCCEGPGRPGPLTTSVQHSLLGPAPQRSLPGSAQRQSYLKEGEKGRALRGAAAERRDAALAEKGQCPPALPLGSRGHPLVPMQPGGEGAHPKSQRSTHDRQTHTPLPRPPGCGHPQGPRMPTTLSGGESEEAPRG